MSVVQDSKYNKIQRYICENIHMYLSVCKYVFIYMHINVQYMYSMYVCILKCSVYVQMCHVWYFWAISRCCMCMHKCHIREWHVVKCLHQTCWWSAWPKGLLLVPSNNNPCWPVVLLMMLGEVHPLHTVDFSQKERPNSWCYGGTI